MTLIKCECGSTVEAEELDETQPTTPDVEGSPLPAHQSGLREQLAALCHEQWSGWMQYQFGVCAFNENHSLLMPEPMYRRWKRQADTPYDKLPENEKKSDRKEADRILAILSTRASDASKEIEELKKRVAELVLIVDVGTGDDPATTMRRMRQALSKEYVRLKSLYDGIFVIKSTGDPKHPVKGDIDYGAKADFEKLLEALISQHSPEVKNG